MEFERRFLSKESTSQKYSTINYQLNYKIKKILSSQESNLKRSANKILYKIMILNLKLDEIDNQQQSDQDNLKAFNDSIDMHTIKKESLILPQHSLGLIQQTRVQQAKETIDDYPCLFIRRQILTLWAVFRDSMLAIVRQQMFDNLILLVILANFVIELAMNTDTYKINGIQISDLFYFIFIGEFLIKLLALGISYFQDIWNRIDFIILLGGSINLLGLPFNLNLVRTVKVLKPLRTIRRIESIKLILRALVQALPIITDTIVLQGASYAFLGLLGQQLLMGKHNQVCFYAQNGMESAHYDTFSRVNDIPYCTNSKDCSENMLCGKVITSRIKDIQNFNNFRNSFLMVYQIVSLEGWSELMYVSQKTHSFSIFIFYWICIFISNFYLLNLIIAALGNEFENAKEEIQEEEKNNKQSINYDVDLQEFYFIRKVEQGMRQFKDKFGQPYYAIRQCQELKLSFGKRRFDQKIGDDKNAKRKSQIAQRLSTTENRYFFDKNQNPLKQQKKISQKMKDLIYQNCADRIQEGKRMYKIYQNSLSDIEKMDRIRKKCDNSYIFMNQKNKSLRQQTQLSLIKMFFLFNRRKKNNEQKNELINQSYLVKNNNDQSKLLGNEKQSKDQIKKRQNLQETIQTENKFAKIKKRNFAISYKLLNYTSNINQIEYLIDKLLYQNHREIILEQGKIYQIEEEQKQLKNLKQNFLNNNIDQQKMENKFIKLQEEQEKRLKNINLEFYVKASLKYLANSQNDVLVLKKQRKIINKIRFLTKQKLQRKQQFIEKTSYMKKKQKVESINENQMYVDDKRYYKIIKNQEFEIKKIAVRKSQSRMKQLNNQKQERINEQTKINELLLNKKEQEESGATIPEESENDSYNNEDNLITTNSNQTQDNANISNNNQQIKISNNTKQDYKKFNYKFNIEQQKDKQQEQLINEIQSKFQHKIFIKEEEKQRLLDQHQPEQQQIIQKIINNMQKQAYIQTLSQSQSIESYWSGDQIYPSNKNISQPILNYYNTRFTNILSQKNNTKNSTYIWKSYLQSLRNIFYKLIINETFDALILLLVLFNTILMVIDLTNSTQTLTWIEQIYPILTYAFIIEAAIKILALGINSYLKDLMNLFDLSLVITSIVEIELQNHTSSNNLHFLQVFRMLRVLRVTRLIRRLQYMRVLIQVMSMQLTSALSIALLLLIIMSIFSVLGMNIYKDQQFTHIYRQSFLSVLNSYLAVFQMLTLENWNEILYACLMTDVNWYITVIYLITCQFVLAHVLHSLFQAILLQGFEDPSIIDLINKQNKQSQHQSQLIPLQTNTNYLCYMFPKTSPIRAFAIKLVKSTLFDPIILILIILSSLSMAISSYKTTTNTMTNINIMAQIVTYVFIAECLIKVIALGVSNYIRDNWNKVDGLCVALSLLEMTMDNDYSLMKVLRLARVLRPLRFISRNKSMKLIVIALLESFHSIFNVGIVILLFWVMLGILGVNLFKQQLGYCTFPDNYGVSYDQCPINQWKRHPFHMDTIQSAMLTMFVFASLEGWNTIVYAFMDSNNQEQGPLFNHNQNYALMYNIPVLYTGAFICINLFVGVIFLNYVMADQNNQKQKLSIETMNYIKILKICGKSKNRFKVFQQYNRKLFKFIDHFMTLVTMFNIFTIASQSEDISLEFKNMLFYYNSVVYALYFLEVIVKLMILKVKLYFIEYNNIFDFSLICLTLLGLFIENLRNNDWLTGESVDTIIYILSQCLLLRIFRMVKVLKKFKGILKLIIITGYLVPVMLNVLALIFLLMFIFAVLGNKLFSGIMSGMIMDDQDSNFKNFGNSFFLVFKMSTGEDWHLYMYDCMQVNNLYSIYFIVFVILFQYIMLNLFVLVILKEFDNIIDSLNNQVNIQKFEENLYDFKFLWNQITKKYKGNKIHQSQIIELILILPQPIGQGYVQQKMISFYEYLKLFKSDDYNSSKMNFLTFYCNVINNYSMYKENHKNYTEKLKLEEIKRKHTCVIDTSIIISQMDLKLDQDDFIYYNDFILQVFKRQHIYKVMSKIGYDEVKVIQKATALTNQKSNIIKTKILRRQFKLELDKNTKIYNKQLSQQSEQSALFTDQIKQETTQPLQQNSIKLNKKLLIKQKIDAYFESSKKVFLPLKLLLIKQSIFSKWAEYGNYKQQEKDEADKSDSDFM